MSAAPAPDTALDLRRLFRESEARAARLRMLVEAGQALAGARGPELDAVADRVARQAALLLGYAGGSVVPAVADMEAKGDVALLLPLTPAGGDGRPVATMVLTRRVAGADRIDPADEEAVAVLRQLIAGALAARAREERLSGLLSQLLGAQERERAHVARELHDGVAQVATAALRRMELAAESGESADAARAVELARMAVAELRRVIAGMRPTALDDLGLGPALEQLAASLAADGVEVRLAVDLPERPPPHLEAGLFRVAQEALGNVRAHAGAPCRVDLELALRPDHGRIELRVSDDGRGFDPHAPAPADGREHVGLAFMAERAAALGGTLRVDSAPGRGTTVSVRIPAP